MAKGIIALDIDGTLVSNHRPLSQTLCRVLKEYHDSGYILLFATGRTLRWGMNHLDDLDCPFYLAAYNGALLYKVPEREVVKTAFLSLPDVHALWPFVEQFGALLYEGLGEERIFYTPHLFSQKMLDHVLLRKTRQKETFVEISSFDELPACAYASIRFFANRVIAEIVGQTIAGRTSFTSPTMKDSLNPELFVVQVTSHGASKGSALKYIQRMFPLPTIAAGDDMNDLEMLLQATISIAMHEAPEVVRSRASIVAPPFAEDCIIAPLQEAIALL